MEEVKIKKIDVKNLKAVDSFIAIFEGKSAHVTGANGFGKSTVIRALTDRLRGLKPSIITKIGEKEGKTVMELTDSCRFEWEYNDQGKDSLNYFTPNNIKPVRRDVFKHICGQYFPNQFDINKFLTTTEPRKRLQMISELVNVDLTEVQARYKNAFDIRKDAKKELKILEAQIKPKPETQTFDGQNYNAEQKNVHEIELKIKEKKEAFETERDSLNSKYVENKNANHLKELEHQSAYQKELDQWFENDRKESQKIEDFNKLQAERVTLIAQNKTLFDSVFSSCESTFLEKFFDSKGANDFINNMDKGLNLIKYEPTETPELTKLDLPDPMPSSENLDGMKEELKELEWNLEHGSIILEEKKTALSALSASRQVYDLQLKQYQDFQKEVESQSNNVYECEQDVEKILTEIKAIISKTKLPDEFSIDLTEKNDILFKTSPGAEYLPITIETLASSAIFIAAFKLQANYLEAFRVAHFDVSYLDYKNRKKVLDEAISMNIQLITESPAHDEDSEMLQYVITEE